MRIKITMRYHLTQVRMAIIKSLQITNAREGMEKREPSCAVGRIINWSSHYGKNSMEGPEKLKTDLPYDLVIPLLGIYPEKNYGLKNICTPMFTAALFTIAKTWTRPKCPSTDAWIKKGHVRVYVCVYNIYTHIYYT